MQQNTYKYCALLLATGVMVVHLLVAPMVDLSVDEAHYALYAYFPDLSYFDHPPLIGWLLWLLTPWGLDEFTLRVPAALIYFLCCGLLYHITSHRVVGGAPLKGFVAVGVFSIAPMVQILGFGLVPEFPLLLWSLLIALCAERLDADSPLPQWLLLGALMGLAGLSKYTAVLLVPSLAAFWLAQRKLGRILLSSRAYLAAALAIALISPVLLWNYQHDWASFRYQINHAGGGDWEFSEVLRAALVQLLTYSPLIVIGGLAALRHLDKADMRGLLAWLATPILLFVTIGAGNGKSLPHWTLVAWSALIPAMSHWVVDQWSGASVRRLAIGSSALSVLLSTLIIVLAAYKPLAVMPWAAPALRDLVGWREAAQRARELNDGLFPEGGVIMVHNWARASRIAWYARPTPVQVLDRRPGQFAYWYGAANEQSRGILVKDNPDGETSPTYQRMGFHCELLEQKPIIIDGVLVNNFDYYSCHHQTQLQTDNAESRQPVD